MGSEDGMFVFPDFDAFNLALNAVAPPTTKPTSESQLAELESTHSVTTFQRVYLDRVLEYDTQKLPDDWFSANADIVSLYDNGILPTIGDIAVRTLVNSNGQVRVGDDLYIFTKDRQYIVPAELEPALLDEILTKGRSDLENGIYVLDDWQDNNHDLEQKTCDGASSLNCSTGEVDDHRVRGVWGVTSVVRTNRITICSGPDRSFCFPRIVSFTVSPRYFANAKVEDRGLFNRWTRDQTILSFTCGIKGNGGLRGSGQGWTSSTPVHEINVSWSAGPSRTFDVGTQPTAGPTLNYVTGGVDDERITGLFCFKCCPWDCSDLDEDNIP